MCLASQLALVETLWREELKVLQASTEILASVHTTSVHTTSVHTTRLASPECLGSPPVVGVT